MIPIRIITFAVIVLAAGCGDSERSRPSWPERSAGARTLGKRRLVVYPYSIVPGGVDSKAAVREAMDRDPSVARHYADIRADALEVVKLKSGTLAYVSFRKGGRIYWTSRRVPLSPGERILSDGASCLRGRCGNRISWQPRSPVLPKGIAEPGAAEFDTPDVPGASADKAASPQVLAEQQGTADRAIGTVPGAMKFPAVAAPAFLGAVASAGGGAAVSGAGGSSGGSGGGAPSAAAGVAAPSAWTPAVLFGLPAVTGAVAAAAAAPGAFPTQSVAAAEYMLTAPPVVQPVSWTNLATHLEAQSARGPAVSYPPYAWPPPAVSPPPPPLPPGDSPKPPAPSSPPPPHSPLEQASCPLPRPSDVPEPSSFGLIAIGAAAVLCYALLPMYTKRTISKKART